MRVRRTTRHVGPRSRPINTPAARPTLPRRPVHKARSDRGGLRASGPPRRAGHAIGTAQPVAQEAVAPLTERSEGGAVAPVAVVQAVEDSETAGPGASGVPERTAQRTNVGGPRAAATRHADRRARAGRATVAAAQDAGPGPKVSVAPRGGVDARPRATIERKGVRRGARATAREAVAAPVLVGAAPDTTVTSGAAPSDRATAAAAPAGDVVQVESAGQDGGGRDVAARVSVVAVLAHDARTRCCVAVRGWRPSSSASPSRRSMRT